MPDGMFDVESLLAAAGQGKLSAAEASDAPPRAVIDVGTGSNNPAAAPGQFGSQLAIPNVPPVSGIPEVATPNLDTTMQRLRGEQPPFDVESTLKAAGEGKLPAAPEHAQPTEAAPQKDFWNNLAEQAAAVASGIPHGILGNAADWVSAATQTPLRMITHERTPEGQVTIGVQNPLAAFREGLQNEQQINQTLEQQHPFAYTGGQIAGALPLGMAAAPALAYRAPVAAGLLPKIGAAAGYLGRNAAFGAGTSALAGGSPMAGAGVGAGVAAVVPGAAKLLALPAAAYKQFSPLWSQAARQASVGSALQRDIAGMPVTAGELPLDLAQATGSPAVAAKVRYAQGVYPQQAQALQDQQKAKLLEMAGKVGAPASSAEASGSFTDAIRQARKLAGKEENRLWTTGKLANTPVTTLPVQEEINRTVEALDPVLRDSMSPSLKALVNRINKTGATTVRDLNGVRSDLLQITRTSSDGAERSMANKLADAFLNGMDKVPEIVGHPGVPTGRTVLKMDAPGIYRNVPEIGPPIPADPQILQEWQAARDFTRQMRPMFGQPDVASLLAKNPSGAYRVEASEGLKPGGRFFNFANASPEGPESITELSDFVAKLRQPGALKLSEDIKDSARSYIAAALLKAGNLGEGRKFAAQATIDFLNKNQGWLRSSGLLQQPQIDAAKELLDYAKLIRRTEALNPQSNSATQARQITHHTFINEIMTPWVRRLGEIGIAFGAHAHGESIGGAAVGMGLEHLFNSAETAMREMMAEALFNPKVAKELMMKASAGNRMFLSPQTKDLLQRLGTAVRVELPQIGMQQMFPQAALPAPVQMR